MGYRQRSGGPHGIKRMCSPPLQTNPYTPSRYMQRCYLQLSRQPAPQLLHAPRHGLDVRQGLVQVVAAAQLAQGGAHGGAVGVAVHHRRGGRRRAQGQGQRELLRGAAACQQGRARVYQFR